MTNDEIIAKFYEAVQSGDYQTFLDTVLHTQYIGARYVPLFADPLQWSSARAYEPLTIVTNQGNSYTSRQYVPTGIDIANTDYWALTGNYNAQIEQYRQEVQDYAQQVTDLANTVNNIDKELYAKKKAILIGDSYLRNYSSETYESPGWGDFFETYSGYDCSVRYKSGGAGWVNKGTSDTEAGLNFVDMLEKAHTEHTDDANQFKAIVVQGIINDLQTNKKQSDILANIATFCNNAHTWFPNAIVYVSMAVCSKKYQYDTVLLNVVRAMKDYSVTNLRSQVFANNSYYWFLGHVNDWGRGDDIHPNPVGYTKLAQYMANFVNGNVNTGSCYIMSLDDITDNISAQYSDFETNFSIKPSRFNIVNDTIMLSLELVVKTPPSDDTDIYVLFPAFTIASIGTIVGIFNSCTVTHNGVYYNAPLGVAIVNNESNYGCLRLKLNPTFDATEKLTTGDSIKYFVMIPSTI